MTELKTLKDLNLFDDDLKDDIAKEKLKAEAIKWVKHYIEDAKLDMKELFEIEEFDYNFLIEKYTIKQIMAISIIMDKMHFFNITEEELGR